ncbi:MAG: hypothetical protein DBY09_06620 [Selenomonadales bacterium]|nr:MAG: hypothetical protein DBY09_06620 [Selenomonadales bacterium]
MGGFNLLLPPLSPIRPLSLLPPRRALFTLPPGFSSLSSACFLSNIFIDFQIVYSCILLRAICPRSPVYN